MLDVGMISVKCKLNAIDAVRLRQRAVCLLTVRVARGTCDIEGHRVHWSCLPVYTCNCHTNIQCDLLNTEIVVVLSLDA